MGRIGSRRHRFAHSLITLTGPQSGKDWGLAFCAAAAYNQAMKYVTLKEAIELNNVKPVNMYYCGALIKTIYPPARHGSLEFTRLVAVEDNFSRLPLSNDAIVGIEDKA